jgi:Cytochrome P460
MRSQQNRLRIVSPRAPGGFQIDHQLNLLRRLDREIGGLRALLDLVDEVRGAPVYFAEANAIRHEPALVWNPKEMEALPHTTVPASLHDVDFLVKDSKRFADSGGWGWAAFKYNAAGTVRI